MPTSAERKKQVGVVSVDELGRGLAYDTPNQRLIDEDRVTRDAEEFARNVNMGGQGNENRWSI